MRTTVTLDEDVAAKLESRMRRSGKSFKETLNEVLRLGLMSQPTQRQAKPAFQVRARDLGNLAAGLSLDNVAHLLERLETPARR